MLCVFWGRLTRNAFTAITCTELANCTLIAFTANRDAGTQDEGGTVLGVNAY